MNQKTFIIIGLVVLIIVVYSALGYSLFVPKPELTISTAKTTKPGPSPADRGKAGPSAQFPVGMICVNSDQPYSNRVTEEFPAIAAAGFNLIHSYQFFQGMHEPYNTNQMAREYLDVADRNGLKVLMAIPKECTDNTNRECIQTRVNALKDHRALWGWWLYDEPENHSPVTPALLESAYQAIQARDSTHPITIATASDVGMVLPYRNGFDWSLPQWLFAPLWDFFGSRYDATFREDMAALTTLQPPKSLMQSLIAYNVGNDSLVCGPNSPDWSACRHGYPTSNEMRFLSLYSIMRGAQGVLFSCYRFAYEQGTGDDISPRANPQQWARVSSVSRELAALNPVIASPTINPPGITVTDRAGVVSDIVTMLKQYQNNYYLFVANPTNNPTDLEVRFVDRTRFANPIVRFQPDQREIPLGSSGDSFTDRWAAYDVRIYVIGRR